MAPSPPTIGTWWDRGIPAFDKTSECTGIPNIRGTQESAFTNMGHISCFRDGTSASIPHQVMFDRVAAEFGLDPTEVALKNDGCRGHYWDWVTQYQKDNGFPQRWSLKEVIDKGKKAIDWDRKWHAPGTKRLANGKMHGMGFMSINEWACDFRQQAGVFDASRRQSRHRGDALRSGRLIRYPVSASAWPPRWD